MRDEKYKPIHDGLHEFAGILKEWAERFRELAEQLHVWDSDQRRLDEDWSGD